MTITNLQESKELRKQGARLGRAGMSQRAHDLIIQYVSENNGEPNYKKVIELAGRLHAIYIATGCDDYWREKAFRGYWREFNDIKKAERIEVQE